MDLDPDDPRNLPNYTIGEVAPYLGVPESTVMAWSIGRGYRTRTGDDRRARALFPIAQRRPPTLSFWNLVELYVLASIRRKHRVPLQRVRTALHYVERELQVERPLIREQFYTDGVHLFVDRFSRLVSASERGQTALRQLLEGCLQRIDRDPRGIATRLFPWAIEPTEARAVEIDPHRAFGRLVVKGTGIPTRNLAERFHAGESLEELSKDFQLGIDQVEAAMRFELRAA